MHFYSKFGYINNALNIFHNISFNKINIVTINIIMKCLINNNQNEYTGHKQLM